jgi:hypothetical protein
MPSLAARARSFFREIFRFHNLFKPLRTAAASDEAPPSPEERGMFLVMMMCANFLIL